MEYPRSIHRFEKKIDDALGKVELKMRGENRELSLKFYDHIKNDLAPATTLNYLLKLNHLDDYFKGKPFMELTRDDINGLLNFIKEKGFNGKGTGFSHMRDWRASLKRLWKFWKSPDDNEYPYEVRHIKTSVAKRERIVPKILTGSELKRMLDVCDHVRDKALFLCLYESGNRISEFLGWRIGQIQSDKYGMRLTVKGKTGERHVRLIYSAPALSMWLSVHPGRHEKGSFVWVNIGCRGREKRMTYQNTTDIIKRKARQAGIGRVITAQMFRAGRATDLSMRIPDQVVKNIMGWTQSSRAPEHYINITGSKQDSVLLELYGIKEKGDDPDVLKLMKCPRCGLDNSPDSDLCRYCSLPLGTKGSESYEEKQKQDTVAMYVLNKIFEGDPALRERIKEVSRTYREEIERMLK